MNFIEAYLSHTKDFESPGSFWRWSAYATISAVIRDNIWKKDGNDKLYPNIYVLFLASSGARKGRPVSTSQKLVAAANNTKIISGRASIQAIIDDLTNAETTAEGKLVRGGAAVFFAPELSAGIVSDPAAVSIMTDIYDCKPTGYETSLRGRGKSKVDNIVFTMLAASNEAMLDDAYTNRSIEGGLLARTFLVMPDEFRKRNSLLEEPRLDPTFDTLILRILELTKLKGEIKFTDEAAFEYDKWYVPFGNSMKDKSDKSGIMGRIHTGVLKLAMILAANDNTIIIKKWHVEKAINECLELLPNYQKFIMAGGNSDISKAGGIIVTELQNAPNNELSKRNLLEKHWTSFDVQELEAIMATLSQADLIEIQPDRNGNVIYKLTKRMLQKLKEG